MKNVAGYDVSRLVAGSLGTLGLIAEVSLKVLPRPAAEITLGFDADEAEAIARLNRWGRPLPLSASFWHGLLLLRLSGAAAAGGRPNQTGRRAGSTTTGVSGRASRPEPRAFASDIPGAAAATTTPPGAPAAGHGAAASAGGHPALSSTQRSRRRRPRAGATPLFRGWSRCDAGARGLSPPANPGLLLLHRRLKKVSTRHHFSTPAACTPNSDGPHANHLPPFNATSPPARTADAILRTCVHWALHRPARPTSCWGRTGWSPGPHLPHQGTARRPGRATRLGSTWTAA